MGQTREDSIRFEGEEATAGYAAPFLDLIATLVLIALSVTVMAASLVLPVPGGLRTAPGLLPFLTAASLAVMAAFLGLTAIRRHRAGVVVPEAARDRGEDLRTLLLALAVAGYIGCLHFAPFQVFFTIGGSYFTLSAFEPATIVALTAIIHLFWGGPLWVTTGISVGWTLLLSVTFQKLFALPLPGGF